MVKKYWVGALLCLGLGGCQLDDWSLSSLFSDNHEASTCTAADASNAVNAARVNLIDNLPAKILSTAAAKKLPIDSERVIAAVARLKVSGGAVSEQNGGCVVDVTIAPDEILQAASAWQSVWNSDTPDNLPAPLTFALPFTMKNGLPETDTAVLDNEVSKLLPLLGVFSLPDTIRVGDIDMTRQEVLDYLKNPSNLPSAWKTKINEAKEQLNQAWNTLDDDVRQELTAEQQGYLKNLDEECSQRSSGDILSCYTKSIGQRIEYLNGFRL